MELPKDIDLAEIEKRWQDYWEAEGVYHFDPDGEGPVYSIDTPPPYVSAAHLHVGHAMSYAQAEFIIRYRRMKGWRIYYPMGFDDNGLPTERYVEKVHDIDKRKTTREAFRNLCLAETAKGAKVYEELWRALGLSVDWRQRYSTIDPHCRRTAQLSFLDLFGKGRIYRSEDPVLWDTHFETALAQADLESIARQGKLHDIAFTAADTGEQLVIATTRPELIPACVALYCNGSDERYAHLVGKMAKVPLTDREVPILADDDVDTAFGTGLMQVCTFGDGEDVRRWKRDGLATRVIVGRDGKMLETAGKYAGMDIDTARRFILRDLAEAGALLGGKATEQNVSVSERSGVPVEFLMAPQWFIRVLDLKDDLLKRSAELEWHPAWMKARLDHWIEGLKYDWNITRQRFYGVPVPVWFCDGCGEVVLARVEDLPVDPLEDACPVAACAKCGGTSFHGDPDVLDTWMTSSLTPLINANWAQTPGRDGSMAELYPMSLRVQAFEIIRTWLFYTLVKSHLHHDGLPWTTVMISGWGLNEQGKKISKRDLEKSVDKTGFNPYEPYDVIRKYGADSLRLWATGAGLGQDLRYNEGEVKLGRKLLIKLWNAARMALMNLDGFEPGTTVPLAERTTVDRWIWHHCNRTLAQVSEALDACDFATARQVVDRFFWHHFCDYYLELVKDRFWLRDRYSDAERLSAQVTLATTLRRILSMYAIFLPHLTEELWQLAFRAEEGGKSLHLTRWPAVDEAALAEVEAGERIVAIMGAVRARRTALRLKNSQRLEALVLDAPVELRPKLEAIDSELRAAARADELRFGGAEQEGGLEGLRIELIPAPLEVTP